MKSKVKKIIIFNAILIFLYVLLIGVVLNYNISVNDDYFSQIKFRALLLHILHFGVLPVLILIIVISSIRVFYLIVRKNKSDCS